MNAVASGGAPSFPMPVLLAVTALCALIAVLAMRSVTGAPARFAIAAVWARYILSAFHEVTYRELAGGLSGNALGSITITAIGLAVISPRYLLLKALVPIYATIAVLLLSAGINAGVASALQSVVKFVYLAVLMIAVYQALRANGSERFFPALLAAFVPLVLLQLLSLATGTVKASELDGSSSYIGGYDHEAAFSVALATAFFVVALVPHMRPLLRLTLTSWLLVALVLANYRTTIIAALPVAAFLMVQGITGAVQPRLRALVFGVAGILTALTVIAVAQLASERFADLTTVVGNLGSLIKPPSAYGYDEQRLLSGRPYIWANYIDAWWRSDGVHRMLGHGPDSWEGVFRVYPHNTLVGFLYELGLVGVAVLLLLWFSMARLAFAAARRVRGKLVVMHLAFILLNLATMALWQIEGIILYAILCGYSVYCAVMAQQR